MTPLTRFALAVDRTNLAIGRTVAWLALVMVLVQFAVVVLRYIFGLGFIWAQESITYMHGLIFMVGAGFTLLTEGHVRVDVFYRSASSRYKAMVDLFGAVAFLIPFCALIAWVSYPYVANSWRVFEGSKETSGIQAVFLLKSVILVFAGLVVLQALSMAVRAGLRLAGVNVPSVTGEDAEDGR